jgi:hypothetical protein
MKTHWRASACLVCNTLNIYVNQKCVENFYKKKLTFITLGFKPSDVIGPSKRHKLNFTLYLDYFSFL